MSSPKVSVLLPSLNVYPYIRMCMESVINQTLNEIEIICIDASSTDGTWEILREYAESDPRIKLIRSDRKSYGYQMNLGLEAAAGEYVGIVETDDYIDTRMYERLYTAAKKAGYPEVVKSGYISLQEHEVGDEYVEKYICSAESDSVFNVQDHYEILSAHPSIWSCIYKNSFLEEKQIHFMEEQGAGWVDNPFLFRTLCEAESICWVKEALYIYREERPGSSFFIKDCSIPIKRISDIKTYLDNKWPDDRDLQRVLYKRAVYYLSVIENNPSLTEGDISSAKEMLKRFDRSAVSDMEEKARDLHKRFFDYNPKIPQLKNLLTWFRLKLRGGIKCLRDNGFIYTIRRFFIKLYRFFYKKINKNQVEENIKPTDPRNLFSYPKNKLRVLFVASDNNHTSGAFISMTILNRILREKFNVETFVVLPMPGHGEKLLRENNINYCMIPSSDWVIPLSREKDTGLHKEIIAKKQKNEKAITDIIDLINKYDFDLVHINTTYSYVGAIAALRTGIPFVWHLREFLEEDQGNTLWDRNIGNSLINKADRVIAISDSIYQKYSGIIDEQRLVKIYNGIDADRFYLPDKEILLEKNVSFIMVGGFQKHKGQEEFADACVKLKKSGYNNFSVSFIGEGDQKVKERVRKIIEENGLKKFTSFFGYQHDVESFLKKTDILFVCARSEAFGRTTVEAMLAGNLVIGANTAGTKELIRDGETGFLYSLGNTDDLCEKMIYVINHREQSQRIASQGRAFMHNNMTAEINAEKVYNLYGEILNNGRN